MVRKIILFLTLLLSTSLLCAPSDVNVRDRVIYLEQLKTKIIEVEREKQLNLFLNDLGYQESRNNPNIYNKFGYIGRFQFGQAARNATGYGHIKTHDFIKDPSIWSEKEQISAMKILLQKNELQLLKYIVKTPYKIRNITITKSGILASAHLAGVMNVKRFLETDGMYDPSDAFGSRLGSYMIRFSDYNF